VKRRGHSPRWAAEPDKIIIIIIIKYKMNLNVAGFEGKRHSTGLKRAACLKYSFVSMVPTICREFLD
jgi:hypothetical protein